MPKELEEKLHREARKLGRKGKLKRKKGMSLRDAEKAYTYGTMRKIGKNR